MNRGGVVFEVHYSLNNHTTKWERDEVFSAKIQKMLGFNMLPCFAWATGTEEPSLVWGNGVSAGGSSRLGIYSSTS